MRRSQRLLEKKLKATFALPDNESDSENECDEGAKEELNQQNVAESEFLSDLEDNQCDEYDDESSEESCSGSDEEGWSHNTNVLDEINLSFKNPSVVGNIAGKEIDYFEKIFDSSVINKVVEETNIYAEQTQSTNWTELTGEELKAYIGCHIIMGIHKLPNVKAYWSSDPMLRVDAVADTMPENRFEKITQNLHLNNNENILPKTDINYDKLHKVRPLIDILNENIGKIYDPSSFVTVDESMIKFKGRCVLKQYMPLKPIKRGYKVWCLADAVTGFIIAFIIYTGKRRLLMSSLKKW